MPTRTRQELEALAATVGHRWWHSIDLGQGVVTPGTKPPTTMAAEIAALGLPEDLSGKTVLDIGAWDGAFSFECERRGAARVVALDHFIWSVDLDAQQSYLERCAAEGRAPRPWDEVPEVWKPDELPGKAGFDAAHAALGSSVEAVVDDFMTMDLDALGAFDVVLYLGVLYHMPNPFLSLGRVAQVTREVAVVETEMLVVPGAEHYGVWEFIAGDELGRDPTNWWVPNSAGLAGMLRAVGFDRVELPDAPRAYQPRRPPEAGRYGYTAKAAVRAARTAYFDPAVEYPEVAPIRFRGVTRARR